MSSRKTVLWNASWSWAGMAANMAAGFVTAPFLVRRLGETNYGLWIVIGRRSPMQSLAQNSRSENLS